MYLNYSLCNLLVEDHPDQEGERVLREELIGVGIAGEMELRSLCRHAAKATCPVGCVGPLG